MEKQVLPISIVIPVRNESPHLPELFELLELLSPAPAEVIFVDTGSSDNSLRLIDNWGQNSSMSVLRCICHQGFPGAARNVGILAATQDWIAFLDVGILPRADWLGSLWRWGAVSNADAIYGFCRFDSDQRLGRMLCAVSYGVGRLRPVLPASLFKKNLFDKVCFFRTDLRAGEDIFWKNCLQEAGVDIAYCHEAMVEYKYFPDTLRSALVKQHVYEKNATIAGIGGKLRATILMTHLAMYPALIFAFYPAATLLVLYLFFRGILDPIRRSGVWWQDYKQVLALPILVAGLDVAAALGRLRAWFKF